MRTYNGRPHPGGHFLSSTDSLLASLKRKRTGSLKKFAVEYEFGHRNGGCVVDNDDHAFDYIILLPAKGTKATLTNSIYYLHCDGQYYNLERAEFRGRSSG